MARHGVGVVGDGEQRDLGPRAHPMKFLYGYSVAAELQPETRYDELVETLGCEGILVASRRAAAGAGARLRVGAADLVNVLTDPEIATAQSQPRLGDRSGQNRRRKDGDSAGPQDGQGYVFRDILDGLRRREAP